MREESLSGVFTFPLTGLTLISQVGVEPRDRGFSRARVIAQAPLTHTHTLTDTHIHFFNLSITYPEEPLALFLCTRNTNANASTVQNASVYFRNSNWLITNKRYRGCNSIICILNISWTHVTVVHLNTVRSAIKWFLLFDLAKEKY